VLHVNKIRQGPSRKVIIESFGKLFTASGEIVAEGTCQVDMDRGSVTLRPIVDTPLLSRRQGALRLSLDDGTELKVQGQIIRFRLNVAGVPPGPAYRMTVATGPQEQQPRSAGAGS
jgi:hypothetical protein